MKEKYIAQAATQEEAISKGLNALGISKDEARITIEEPGKKGFLGIGQKDAVVIVERKEKVNLVDEFLSSEFDMDRQSRPKATEAEQEEKEEAIEQAAFPDEERDQPLVDEDPKKVEAKKQEAAASKEEILAGREPADVEILGEEKDYDQEYEAKEDDEADDDEDYVEKDATDLTEEDIYTRDQTAIEEVRQYLKEIILAMGVEDVEVYTSRVKNNVKYDIETENAGLVIGRHGKVLNGLQTLAQNHMHQLAHSKINVRADAEKYRERRKNTVESLANRTAEKVIKTNRTVKLDPMPAHERKQIHRYLNQNAKVKTHSEGREPKRYLVVEPADQ